MTIRYKHTLTTLRGFSLVEIIVAVGLFTVIMALASGAYLLMISVNRQTQALAIGINNLSFALETMTYNIRTGSNYNCAGSGDCSGGTSFSFTNAYTVSVEYSLSGEGTIQETKNGTTVNDLTDSSVNVTSLKFYTTGTQNARQGDYTQARVTIIVSGTVSSGPGKTESFTVQSGATMRGSDL